MHKIRGAMRISDKSSSYHISQTEKGQGRCDIESLRGVSDWSPMGGIVGKQSIIQLMFLGINGWNTLTLLAYNF